MTQETTSDPAGPLSATRDHDDALCNLVNTLVRFSATITTTRPPKEAYLTSQRVGGAECLIVDVRMQGTSELQLLRLIAGAGRSILPIFAATHAVDGARSIILSKAGPRSFVSRSVMSPFCGPWVMH